MQPLILGLVLAAVSADSHRRGFELYTQKKYAEAIIVLQEAAKAEAPDSPDYKESALLIGQSYFMLSQAPKAIPWLEKASNANEANYMLGYAYLQANLPAQAEGAFARLFNLKPNTAAAYLMASQMMLKKDYADDALREVTKALALNPKLPEAHFLAGEIAIFQGRIDDGISELKAELALNPNFSMAWYRLGDAYTRKELWSDAVPQLQRAVWLNPDFSGPYILLGKCYFKQANYSNAEGILRRALILDANNHSATYLLGQTLMAAGKKEEAKAVLDRLKTLQQP